MCRVSFSIFVVMKILIQKLGLLFHLCYFCDILLLKYILCKYLEVVNTIKKQN